MTNSNTILSVPNPGSRNYLSLSYGLLTEMQNAMLYFLLSGLLLRVVVRENGAKC